MKINLTPNLVNEQKIKLTDIKNISISYKCTSIHLCKSETDELILKEYMNFEPEEYELAEININNDTLTIKSEKKIKIKLFGIMNEIRIAEIYIPVTYLDFIEVSSSSGSIKSDEEYKFAGFKAVNSSGSIKLNTIFADNIVLSTSSGSIKAGSLHGNKILKASSGSIKVENTSGENDFLSSSGSIIVNSVIGRIKASSSSGSVKIAMAELNNDISLESSSGSVSLAIPAASSFVFKAKTSSGSIRTYFENQLSYNQRRNQAFGQIGEFPSSNIDLKASSGSIKVTSL